MAKPGLFIVGWVEHGTPVHGALREPTQNNDKHSQGFDPVRNPPFLNGSLHAPYSYE
jgi:hypothetical protein